MLAADSMKPNKLKRHLERFIVISYKIARCKRPHTIGEELILPAAIEIVEISFGDNFAKQLQSIPLSNDTVARRIDDTAEDVECQLLSKLRDKLFSIQLDEATDSNKNAHFIAYVRFCDDLSVAEQHAKVVFVTNENHLAMLAKNFKMYFLDDDELISSYKWVRDTFQNTSEGLSIEEEETFIDFTASGETKRQFSNKSLFEFWAGVNDEFFALKTKAFRILLPFSTSYLCETGFSAVASLKKKYRSRLNIENELRVSISNIKPSFEKLCSARQAQESH
ncbi:protein FAM200A-like [Stegodyphus dumicola]|uniref:protein FAM200A-like n=1 Tax=Stegodyphus dumicola TaxID=202533 RepID=UPI0015AAEDBA|nr:protein FAM200A-like [Stegodyphus dumicola]